MLLRIDDTDVARNLPGGEEAILDDLRWLGIDWDEGPVRQSERRARYREAAAGLPQRFQGVTLLRDDGSATYHLASVVDDIDFGITHVIRANEHRPNDELHRAFTLALGAEPPSTSTTGSCSAPTARSSPSAPRVPRSPRCETSGIPAEAVRAYLEELGIPRHDVRLDLGRIRSLAVEVIASAADEELAGALGVPARGRPGCARRARPGRGARACALDPGAARRSRSRRSGRHSSASASSAAARATGLDAEAAKAIVRELKAVGGNLRAVRRALTGRESGPELWAVIAALPRDETLRRVDAAL